LIFNWNEYSIVDNEVTITGYTGTGGDIIIPATIEGKPVTSIGDWAFSVQGSITSVAISDGVTSIGKGGFAFCSSLTSAVIPDSVTSIGERAFDYCTDLASVTIPVGVTSIGEGAFTNCSALTSITVETANPLYSSLDGVLFDKNQATLIQFPAGKSGAYLIPTNVTSIGNSAFWGCSGLTAVTIPDSVTSIGTSAFRGCSGFTTVKIPTSVISIGGDAFDGCTGLRSVTIPSSITSIEEYTFISCSGLESMTIPDSVTSIGSGAFAFCTGLTSTSVVIPTSITSIGSMAFYGCSGLTSVVISTNVTSIGERAFATCEALASIIVETANPSYSSLDGVLFDKNQTALIQFPAGKSGAYSIPTSVTSIGENAFLGCSGLTSVTLPNSVTTIEKEAFRDCSGLTSVTIPASVTSIGTLAFYGCFSLIGLYFLGTPPEVGANSPFDDVPGTAYYISGTLDWGTEFAGLPTAVWTIEATFDGNGGTPDYASRVYNAGLAYGELPAANRSGYAFAGWWTALDESGTEITASTQVPLLTTGHTLYAKWTLTAPIELTASDGTSLDAVNLSWMAATGATGYKLYRGSTDDPSSATLLSSPEDTSYTDSTAAPGVLYTYWVKASDAAGDSALSESDTGYRALAAPTNVSASDDDSIAVTVSWSAVTGATHYRVWRAMSADSAKTALGDWQNALSYVDNTADISTAYYYWVSAAVDSDGARSSDLSNYAIGARSAAVDVSDYEYTISNNQVTITRYTGDGRDIVIPSTIEGLPVTSIGDWTFMGCFGLTSVEIPDNVTSIGEQAFSDCHNLTGVVIGDGVTSIGDFAFMGCFGLTSVEIPDSVTSIGEQAFSDCHNLTGVVIGDGVTSIGDFAFMGCSGLTSVIIPNSVTSIGRGAFSSCHGLTNVTIPNSVTSIGSQAFGCCAALTSITVEAANLSYSSLDGVLFDKNKTTLIQFPEGKSGAYSIPTSVTSIGENAFWGCSGLTSVTIPTSVASIGGGAFGYCTGLTSVAIPDGVTTIENWTFGDCFALTSVVIPSSVTSIGMYAFYGCYSLANVVIPDNVTSIGELAFASCSGLMSVAIGDSVTSIGGGAFDGCTGLTRVTIPNSVTSIGGSVFLGCTGLTKVTIPTSVTIIGSRAFADCSALTSITVETANPSYSSLDGVLFDKNQTQLIQFPAGKSGIYLIPTGVTSIGDSAFMGCASLTRVIISNSVTCIENYAFHRCSGLTSVTIPDSVTSIRNWAFSSCSSLASLYFLGTPPEVGTYSPFNRVPGTAYYISGTLDWGTEFAGLPTAVWTIEATFDGNGGTPDYTSRVYNAGLAYGELPAANRSGYAFAGWWTALDESGTEITASTQVPLLTTGHTLYAKWTLTAPIELTASDGTSLDAVNLSWMAATGATGYKLYRGSTDDPSSATLLSSPEDTSYTDSTAAPGVLYTYWVKASDAAGDSALSESDTGYRALAAPTNVSASDDDSIAVTVSWSAVTGATHYRVWRAMSADSTKTALGDWQNALDYADTTADVGTTYYYWVSAAVDSSGTRASDYSVADTGVRLKLDYEYSISNNQVTITGYIGDGGDIVIPSTIEDLPVTSIGDWAFEFCYSLSSVVIGDGVTSIGNGAFARSSLSSVVIGDGVTSIGNGAFADSNLSSVVIGDGVTSIGDWAFEFCYSLSSVVIGDGVTSIGNGAFAHSSLSSVMIPASVISIGDGAFSNCMMLYSITVETANPSYSSLDGVLFDKNQTQLIQFPQGKDGAYSIPTSVTSIGDSAFYDCYSLTSVMIPASVTRIGDRAFYWCSGLTSVTIPASVTSIGGSAFYGCYGLTSVTIPASVTSIGNWAFNSCSSLASLYFLGTPPEVGTYSPFNGVPGTAYYIFGMPGWGTEFAGLPTAVWTSEVAFAGNGGTPDYTSRVYNVGNAYGTLPTATRPGYSFAGWWRAQEAGDEVTADDNVQAYIYGDEHTLYARWTINQYTITFDSAGGSAIDAITSDYGSNIAAPVSPIRVGHTFAGWNPPVPAAMPPENLTIVAQWTTNQYEMTFDSAGGTAVDTIHLDYGTTVTAPVSPTRNGYTFVGWEPPLPVTMPAENLTHIAQWTINIYKLEYNAGEGGTVGGRQQLVQEIVHGHDAAPVVAIPANGCRFVRWSDGVTTPTRKDTTVVDSMQVTAEFEPKWMPAITWPIPSALVYGLLLSDAQLNAEANILGTFVYDPPAGTLLPVGTHTLHVTFMPQDDVNWASAHATVELVVSKAALTITPDAGQSKIYGAADPALTYTVTGAVAGETPEFTGALVRDAGEAVGTYAITGGDLALADDGAFKAANYSLVVAEGATFAITAKDASTLTVADIAPVVYNGAAQTPVPEVRDGDVVLMKDVDYTLSYAANTHAGTATITVTGQGNYSGTQDKGFTIAKAALTITPDAGQLKIYGAIDPALTYTVTGAIAGETPEFTGALVRDAGEAVGTYAITGGDLALADDGAFKAANYSLVVAEGATFAITAKDASTLTVADIAPVVYNGAAQTPEPEVRDGDTLLTKGDDYTLSYAANTHAGTATITVTGQGNYSGTQDKAFTIAKAALAVTPDAGLSKIYGAADPALTYTVTGAIAGETPEITGALVRDAGEAVGTYAITGGNLALADNGAFKAANYSLVVAEGATFAITAKDASTLTVADIAPVVYNGAAQTPVPEVRDGDTLLTKGDDYTLSYVANTHAGTATVTVNGMGNYAGVQEKQFTINRALPNLTWAQPEAIVHGMALSVIQLNATANVPGVFAYEPPIGTIPTVGLHSLSVSFTPDDLVNWTVATGETMITVSPDWANPIGMPNSMEVYAKVRLYGRSLIEEEGSLLAAFKGDECRGVVEISPGPAGPVFILQVFSQANTEADLTLKVWDAATGEMYDVVEQFDFISNGNWGGVSSPMVVNAGELTQEIPLVGGWNWISFNVLPRNPSPGTVLGVERWQENDTIKGPRGIAAFAAGQWWGMSSISAGVRYLLLAQNAAPEPLRVTGTAVPVKPLSLVAGWNWLGFTPQRTISVSKALASLSFADNDTIKHPAGLATFASGQWWGQLADMSPGRGYLLKLARPGTLFYPDVAEDNEMPKMRGPQTSPRTSRGLSEPDWAIPDGYANSMAVYATVMGNDGRIDAPGSRLAAFKGDECRGVVEICSGPTGAIYILQVFSNAAEESDFTLMVWDAVTDSAFEINETFNFTQDGTLGGISTPTTLTVVEPPTGSLRVEIEPAEVKEAGAQWSIDGGVTWHDAGATLDNLPLGEMTISFSSVVGWNTVGTNVVTILADDTVVVTATYVRKTYELLYMAGPGGSLQGKVAQSVFHGQDATPILAVPDEDMRFVCWSDGQTANPRTDVNVIASSTMVAEFAAKMVPAISWPSPSPIVLGMALSSLQCNAEADTPGVFAYDPPVGTALSVGNHVLHVTFTPDDVANWSAATANVELRVVKGLALVLNATPADRVGAVALAFGEIAAAATGMDPYDVPAAVGQAASLICVNESAPEKRHLSHDFRPEAGNAGISRWRLNVHAVNVDNSGGAAPQGRAEAARQPVALSWNFAAITLEREIYLQQLIDEQPVGFPIDMKTTTALDVGYNTVFEIVLAPVASTVISLQEGWNFFGSPFMSLQMQDEIFDRDVHSVHDANVVWHWNKGRYEIWPAEQPLSPERGYFVYCPSGQRSITLSGVKADGVMQLCPGWNLVSPPSDCAVPGVIDTVGAVWQLHTDACQMVAPGGMLKAGNGYWIFVGASEPIMVDFGQ
jgi:uncharacterized repeat protein (TIGR02543 family)